MLLPSLAGNVGAARSAHIRSAHMWIGLRDWGRRVQPDTRPRREDTVPGSTVARHASVTAQLSFHGLTTPRIEASPTLTPFLKWPGGKSSELPLIAALAPPLTGRLIDPFVGGG